MNSYRYKAFISYSHQDRDWSAWLQRAVEGYRIPKRLVGTKGEFGPIPRRLNPVFRDREDLSSSSDLSARVKESLKAAEALIVICSPASAQSAWVNEEIRHFRSLGRPDRIFALIVAGDPQSEDPAQRCFPSALTTDPDGSASEPLAADARKWADGKLLAKLKIISGILGIRLDDLRQRDMQRRQRLWMMSMGGAMSVAIIMTVLAVVAVSARKAAENRREHAEDLVGYMVGDLKTKLDEVGRLDILEGMGGKVSEYLQTLDPEEVTDESLTQQAQVWRQLGEVAMDQGEMSESLRAFSTSRDILAELHRRNPDTADHLYELGNAEFWVGYVHLETGEFEKAEDALGAYLGYAYQLNELEPGNPEWLMEQSYAHSNLAALINRRGDATVEVALYHIREAVEINKSVIELDPENQVYRSEYSEALAWLADTQLLACDLGGALISRQENVEIARNQMEQAPGNVNLKSRYAFSLSGLSSVAQQVGLLDLAIENYKTSREILGQLSILEPTSLVFRFDYLQRDFFIANLLAEKGQLDKALAQARLVREPLTQVLESESYGNLMRHVDWTDYLLSWSEMKWRSEDRNGADELMSEAVSHLERLLAKESDRESYMGQLMKARFLYWQQRGQDLFETAPFEGIEVVFQGEHKSCHAQANLVRQAILTGESELARELSADLLSKGYYEAGFIRVCTQYGLCQGDS